ncbi:efflux RND transporter periplasmic adaptor subunit [Coprobacter fastidiosus]|uniref:efflux RND transporter periplasmic adaptor subunit n=1 Tax=Coprobacter fastidiosus TaxID=1099853 RepID=UPI00189F5215|nr:efflux RND transporter periplasmic adaptor subunit [Coprobacter fastidiosus]
MKRYVSFFLLLLFAVMLVGTFVFLWRKSRPEITVYEVVAPQKRTIEKKTIATGKVEPRDEVLIKPQISGIVSAVYKEAGQMVKAGDVIALVKVIPEMGTLNAAESRVNVAQINFGQTQRDFDRAQNLFRSGVISKEEFEKSQLENNRAKEELQNAQDNLEIVRDGISRRSAQYSNTQIRSTIDGMILDVPVKVGNSVIQSNNFNDGTTIASIANMNDMIFKGKIDETEVGQLHEGMPIKLTVGALRDACFDAVLEYISPKSTEENGTVLFEIKAAASIPDTVFVRAGYSANAEIILDRRENVLTIPESAVEFHGDSTFVQLVQDSISRPQVFVQKPIKTGLSDGISIEVISGVKAGDFIRGNRIIKK